MITVKHDVLGGRSEGRKEGRKEGLRGRDPPQLLFTNGENNLVIVCLARHNVSFCVAAVV